MAEGNYYLKVGIEFRATYSMESLSGEYMLDDGACVLLLFHTGAVRQHPFSFSSVRSEV